MKGHYPNNKKLCIHLIEKHKKYINTTFNRGRRCEITGRRNGVRQDKFQNMWLGQDSTVQYIVLWYECPKWEWTYFWQVIDTPLCVHLNQISTCKTTLKENFTFEKFSRRFTREIAFLILIPGIPSLPDFSVQPHNIYKFLKMKQNGKEHHIRKFLKSLRTDLGYLCLNACF